MTRGYEVRGEHEPGHGHGPDEAAEHEHPDPFYPAPVLDPRAAAAIHDAIGAAVGAESPRADEYRRALAPLEEAVDALYALSGLARRLVHGDESAVAEFQGWLAEHEAERAEHAHKPGAHTHAVSDDAPPGVDDRSLTEPFGYDGRPYDYGPPTGPINLVPVVDAFIAAAFAAPTSDVSLDRQQAGLRQFAERALVPLERIHAEAVEVLLGRLGPETLILTLDRLVQKRPIPGLPTKLTSCLFELERLFSRPNGAVAQAHRAFAEHPLTNRIVGASPATVCVGGEVTLFADAQAPFDDPQPAGVGVYFSPCSIAAPLVRWGPREVVVKAPKGAGGRIYFMVEPADAALVEIQQTAASEIAAVMEGCPFLGGGAVRGSLLGVHLFDRFPKPCPDMFKAAGSRSATVIVRNEPQIVSFRAYDDAGRAIAQPVDACSSVTLAWQARSDDAAPAQVSLAQSNGGTLTGLPLVGSVTTTLSEDRTYTLEVRNSCDMARRNLPLGVRRRITVSTGLVSVPIGQTRQLTVTLPCPAAAPVSLTTTSSQASRVTASAPQLAAGARQVTVTVSGVAAGPPGQAAAVLTIGAPGHEPATVEVWVESPVGRWDVEVHRPGDAASPRADVVAVHMALLRTGKVLVFNYDESDFHHVDKGESGVWDPRNRTFVKRTIARNLFCAGHSQLTDGRVFVAGGQSTAQTVAQAILGTLGLSGRGADHDVHTFDPGNETWSRHRDMPGARWYPTCTTLPDGRVLIISGFWAHRHGIINQDFEIFEPTTATLTPPAHFETRFREAICIYPFVHVLPEGVLFVHSRDETSLYFPDPASGNDLGRTVSNHVYRMVSGNTRNHPGNATSVLLPILGPTPGRVQVLVVGGAGSRETLLTKTTPASRSAEIFSFNPAMASGVRQQGWRATTSMTFPRVLCDAVILPDGTVLVVGGARTGKSAECSDPVRAAELFDPSTETWRVLASASVERFYHQTAILLPDGRVAVAGSTGQEYGPGHGGGSANEFRIEVFTPPYLFRGPPPDIAYAPSVLTYDQQFDVGTSVQSAIDRAVLVRAGSVTHGVNTDQRLLELVERGRAGGRLTVAAPRNASLAPPGYYLLFLISTSGVPSVGRFVQLR